MKSIDRPIRVVVVDDEPLARQRLCRLLEAEPDVTIVAECADGMETLQVLSSSEADLVFLDVQMPEMDGFEVLERIQPHRMPRVVFVTAHDQYAIRAFEASATDYLLKPFRRERFSQSISRVRAFLSNRSRAGLPVEDPRLVIRDGRNRILLPHSEIAFIEAANNYACVHSESKTYVIRETLSSLHRRLEHTSLLRIHRSTIVNSRHVASILPLRHGDHEVRLRSGVTLILSRSYEEQIPKLLQERTSLHERK